MLSKTVLRQAFRTNLDRDDHDVTALGNASRTLSQRLAEFLKSKTGVWAGFEPIGFEPDIRTAIDSATHLRWAYPRVEHESTLSFYEVSTRSELTKNQWGIPEPDPSRAKHVNIDEFHGLLIPGLAFDLNCNRLGRGRGYYDRALAEIFSTHAAAGRTNSHQPLKIGIALERQVSVAPLPHDAHDIAMDFVLTEQRTLKGPVS